MRDILLTLKTLLILAPLILLPQLAQAQAVFYVRAGAVGSGTGLDWTNAYPAIPASMTRGATYYVADGTYSGQTFDEPVSGTEVITIKKATISDHGTGTGWSSTYGDGQANFTGGFTFVTDYWVIDGSTRREAAWNDGPSYGFKTTNVFTNYFAFGHAADSVTLKYLDIGADYGNSDSEFYEDLIYLGGFSETAENWLIHRCYIHNGRVIAQHAGVHNVTYEYSFLGPNWSKTGIRHQVRGSSVTIRFNIFKNACQGQPGVPGVGNSCTAIVGWYGNAGSNGENYTNSSVYGNVFIDTNGTVFYSGGAIEMGDDRTSQGGGPQDCTGCRAFNNTFVGIGRLDPGSHVGLNFGGTITNSEARNNIWYNVGDTTPFCQAASCSNNPKITNGNIFVDAGSENFRLSSNGAAGSGDFLSAPYNTDMDGITRGANGVWDIGAYEFNIGAPNSTPASPTGLRIQQ